MSFSEITRKIANSLIGVFSNEKKHKKSIFQPRRLHIDPLEERQLLSVNVVMPQEKIVTPFVQNSSPTMSANRFIISDHNPYGGAQYTETVWGSDYMASNNQGDTVITWAQNDFVYRMDRDGNYIEDPVTGERLRLTDRFGNFYDDYNVYAQYLTDQVERLTIPNELLSNNVAGASGSFQLVYAPYTVQKLSIKSVTSTTGGLYGAGDNVVMEFRLGGVDVTGNGIADFTYPIHFDENLTPLANARAIERELNNLGGIYADVRVTAESTTDFLITFGEIARLKYGTNAVPELEVRDQRAVVGNYPAAIVSTVSAPVVLSTQDSWGFDQGIIVNPSNPQATAESIQRAFTNQSVMTPFPRVENYTRNMTTSGMANSPSVQVFFAPEVKVKYVDATTFDITFVNGSGMSFHEIMLVSAVDEWGTEYVNPATGGASTDYTQTLKKSSDVFRVNATEENDPFSSVPLVTNQMNPSVAMDSDGDFVITWQSEVGTTSNNTISDIYARRFSPQAIIDVSMISFYDDGYTTERYAGGVPNSPVQGVRPVGDQFKVNTFSNMYLYQPAIGMDPDGNFIIVWSSTYQNRNDGNGIHFKRYDRYGNALTDEVRVTNDDNDPEIYYPASGSKVALNKDGYAVITWVYSDLTDMLPGYMPFDGLFMTIYAPGETTPMPGFERYLLSVGGYNANVSFDASNNFIVSFSDTGPWWPKGGPYGLETADFRAQQFVFDPATGTYSLQRGEFITNSLGHIYRDTYPEESWLGPQFNGMGGVDADGDMVFIYQGYGPDASTADYSYYGINIPGSLFEPYLNPYKNADLLDYFNPAREDFAPYYMDLYQNDYYLYLNRYSYSPYITSYDSLITTDVDVAIREYLARAIRLGATSEQVARLNAILESVAGMMRGGANDIFTTVINKGDWDHSPGSNVAATSSDANVTSTRDGVNSRYYIMIPNYTVNNINGGDINLTLWREIWEDFYSDGLAYYTTGGVTESLPLLTQNAWSPTAFANRLYSRLNSMDENTHNYSHNSWTELLGPIWSNGSSVWSPSAEVNYYAPHQYEALFGETIWALPDYYYSTLEDIDGYHIYEIIFVGGAHDTIVQMGYANGTAIRRPNFQGNPNFIGDSSYFAQHSGYQGSLQMTPGLSVLPNGSYVASWFTNVTTSDGTVVDRRIDYRYFHESTDTVGPKVTDVILPNGQYVANQSTVTYSLEHIVVTFDKELLANGSAGTHSVLNPKNWAIIKDGVQLNNAIKNIYFGMNAAKDFFDSPELGNVLSYGSNKWEVIIEFFEPLGTGSYELVATNMLCDTTGVSYVGGKPNYGVGNALGRDGTTLNTNGKNFTRNFTIATMDGTLSFTSGGTSGTEEKLVSTSYGDHNTRTDDPLDTPKNPTSVASDQNGNFVTVWTAMDADGIKIMAMVYRQTFIETAGGRESVITPIREVQVTNNPAVSPSYASVAMDADGDFVVTWMQEDADGRNIWAKAFNFNGSVRLDADGQPIPEFRVNSHSNGKHNYPDIAMGLDGSFVITWESLNQVSKTGGYDIFFQRYDSACNAIGGVDSIQGIQLNGDPTPGGTFRLRYVDEVAGLPPLTTANITIGTTFQQTALNIKAALEAIGLEVEVGVSTNSILIQFVGQYGARHIAPLVVASSNLINQKAGQSITVSQMAMGASGETRANDTTLGDKRYPSIAMAADGEIIITWTSWGQDEDSPYQTNIYAKNFPANEAVASRNNQVTLADRIDMMNRENNHQKLLMAADSPDNHLTASSEYSGVVYIMAQFADGGIYVGSGSLLSTGMHILTAAHVVAEDTGVPLPIENIVVRFETAAGFEYYGVSQNYVHPSYTGLYEVEVDLAVLTLERLAPLEAQRYDLYRGSDELGSVTTLVGYGTSGTGWTGNILPPGTRRSGQNRFEALGNIFDPTYNPNTLVFDFDSGYPQNDALGYYFGIRNLGLGAAYESSIAGGDSGGPGFIDGRIAGVHSYGGPMFFPSATDVILGVNGSFGEFAVDVRVSAYVDWIDAILVTGESGTFEYRVNEVQIDPVTGNPLSTGNQIWSDVAISMTGEVVFTWTSFNQSGSGDGPGGSSTDISGIFARRFNLDGTPVEGYVDGTIEIDPDTEEITYLDGTIPLGGEFRVNDYIVGNQWYSSVSIANNGDFIIVWESYQDKNQSTVTLPNTGHGTGGTTTTTVTDYGVYAKRFTNIATLVSSQANPGGAQYGLPDATRYIPGYGYVGVHGEIGTEFRINKGQVFDDQTGATVTLNGNGDAIIVFQSQEDDLSKVYYRSLVLNVDRSAPIVTETVLVVNELEFNPITGELVTVDGKPDSPPKTKDGVLMPVGDDSVIYGYPTHMVVTFSEEMFNMYVYDPKSILNPDNWQLSKNGATMFGAIVDIKFRLDMAYYHPDDLTNSRSDKYEAVLTFASPLTSGNYVLQLKDYVTDTSENRLDGDYNGEVGGDFYRFFQVVVPPTAADIPGDPDDPDDPTIPSDYDDNVFNTELGNDKPAMASADDGSFVIVAVHYAMPGTPNEPDLLFDPDAWDWVVDGVPKIGNIVMQRYDRNGNKVGMQQIVNNYMEGIQTDPDVDVDKDGNIAVVWSGNSLTSKNGIYLRLYDSDGKALTDQIWVNGNSITECMNPKVAYDNNGNVLVTWIEYSGTTRSYVIMSRVYNREGIQQNVALNGASASRTSMLLVGESARDVNQNYDIAFAPNGELIITWQMHNTASNSQDIYAKVLKYTNTTLGAGTLNTTVNPFIVNQYTSLRQVRPSVAACATGFVITWVSERQAVLSDRPDLKSDTFDIYARRFNLSGQAQLIYGTTADYLVNSQKVTTERMNDRDFPKVDMAPCGNFVITWSSYDQEANNYDPLLGVLVHDYATFARAFNSNGGDLKNGDASGAGRTVDYMPNIPADSPQEFRLNFTTLGDQKYSVTAISNYGMSFAWVGAADALIFEYDPDTGEPIAYMLVPSVDVFSRTYTVKTNTTTIMGPGNSRMRASSYSVAQATGGGGYIGQGVNTYKYENQETLYLDGTNGNDVFEIIVTASGTFQVTVNGKSVTVGSQVKDIQIDGLGGKDRLVMTNAAGDNTAKINAEDNLVSFATKNGTLTVSALRIDNVEMNVGGENNSLQVVATANDVLTIGVNDLNLVGDGHSFNAKGFETVSALAASSSAKAVLFDSAGDDVLTMSSGKAVMKGDDFEHIVSGFGTINAYSTRGNNTAFMYGSTGDDSVFASSGTVSMAGKGYKNTTFGFEQTYVIGNGGNDSATLAGSYANDRFNATDTGLEAIFGHGNTVNLLGFKYHTIHGNGGNDVVNLNGVTLNSSSGNTKVYKNLTQTYTVVGINDVRGIQPPATPAPVPSPASAYSAIDDDIFQLLAMEHNNGSSTSSNDLDDELDIDFLLKIGALS